MRDFEGKQILVVEDDAIIAWDLATLLDERGASVILASCAVEAVAAITNRGPHAAIVDVDLRGESSESICRRLSLAMIPFAFYTGYGAKPEHWPFAPLIEKPASYDQILSCAKRLCHAVPVE